MIIANKNNTTTINTTASGENDDHLANNDTNIRKIISKYISLPTTDNNIETDQNQSSTSNLTKENNKTSSQ